VFTGSATAAAAAGRFVHVYVDALTRKPTSIPDVIQEVAGRLLVPPVD
jgi:acyl-CoA thioester hydrolase